MQPGDLVGHRRRGVDGGQWEQLPSANLVPRRLVGAADGRRSQLGVAQRHLRGDVAMSAISAGSPMPPLKLVNGVDR